MVCGQQQASMRAHREAHDDRAVGAGRVHHRDRVGGELGLGVRLGLGRPVGAAVAAPVEGDHPAMSCKVGDLHLPVPRMHN